MYYFTIVAMFKNEAHIIKEWLTHYKYHGVDHIYLINDGSTDNYMSEIQSFLDEGYITLYHTTMPRARHRQDKIYNLFAHKHLKETVWIATLDLDEFLYSPYVNDIKVVLKAAEETVPDNARGQMRIEYLVFGSSGKTKQPKSVVQGFLLRAKAGEKIPLVECKKIAYASKTEWISIHDHLVNGPEFTFFNTKNREPILWINHYMVQSKEFFTNVKMKRGDADEWPTTRDEEYFKIHDINDEFDNRLALQNEVL